MDKQFDMQSSQYWAPVTLGNTKLDSALLALLNNVHGYFCIKVNIVLMIKLFLDVEKMSGIRNNLFCVVVIFLSLHYYWLSCTRKLIKKIM